ncbi:MAG: sel1 repeat family protein [Thermoguttaceae bacterium]|nr:sel1 repeat family protein [Thermoguttaceae bacterium]
MDNSNETKKNATDQEKFAALLKAAESGDAEATRELGDRYRDGIGVEQDSNRAVELYRQAAESGDAEAMRELGDCYRYGIGVEQDLEKAFAWYRKYARAWEAAEDAKWDERYRVATAQEREDEVAATKELAWSSFECYNSERRGGWLIDAVQAFFWFRKAAETGDAEAMFGLGNCYERGIGVAKDAKRAFEFYCRAAEAGNAEAMRKTYDCYWRGIGVEKDASQALDWYCKYAEAEDAEWDERCRAASVRPTAQEGEDEEERGDVEADAAQTIAEERERAKAGDVAAALKLGDYYRDGVGVEQDAKRAFDWYCKAALAGDEAATFRLGEVDDWDCSLFEDDENFVCRRKSAETGSVAARKLGDCYRDGIGVEQDLEKAFAWYRKSVSVGGVLSDELTMMTPLLLDRENKESEDEYRRRSLAPKATATAGLSALELGDRYWNGVGVEQDAKKAIELYEVSAHWGSVAAASRLSACYRDGTGVEQDLEKAEFWRRRSRLLRERWGDRRDRVRET